MDNINKRENMKNFAEDGDKYLSEGRWDEAVKCYSSVLANEPDNTRALLGRLLAEFRCRNTEELKNAGGGFVLSADYRKIMESDDEKLRDELYRCLKASGEREESRRTEEIYNDAVINLEKGTERSLYEALRLLGYIRGYRDADELNQECMLKLQEKLRKHLILKRLMQAGIAIAAVIIVVLVLSR